jgi:hypothetical protein
MTGRLYGSGVFTRCSVPICTASGHALVLRYEVNQLQRVVHMNMATHPANAPRTPLGHSIGRIENGELVIETANFTHGRGGVATRPASHAAA